MPVGGTFESIGFKFRLYVIPGSLAGAEQSKRLACEEGVEYQEAHFFAMRNCANFMASSVYALP